MNTKRGQLKLKHGFEKFSSFDSADGVYMSVILLNVELMSSSFNYSCTCILHAVSFTNKNNAVTSFVSWN
jgi:hypothetical protein